MSKRKQLIEIWSGELTDQHGNRFNVLMEVNAAKLARHARKGYRLHKAFERAKQHATAESKPFGGGVVVHIASLGDGK